MTLNIEQRLVVKVLAWELNGHGFGVGNNANENNITTNDMSSRASFILILKGCHKGRSKRVGLDLRDRSYT